MFGVLAVVAGAVYGLEQLKAYVYAQPEYAPAVSLALINPPAWVERESWTARILESVDLSREPPLQGMPLVRQVHDQLLASGWVSRVNRVFEGMDGRIRIDCDFRRPVAMIHFDGAMDEPIGEGFIAVDKDGVRLPELYGRVGSEDGWLRIFGVQSPLPQVGQAYPEAEGDAAAAVRLASLIFEQTYASRISGINVRNFRGRHNPSEAHIVLLTHAGGRIIWGSAIDAEIEEPNWKDKIRTIGMYFERSQPQARIDASVYPDRVIVEPVDPLARAVDGN